MRALVLSLIAVAGCSFEPREASPARPNILLVSIDTLRADHLGCYGYERDTSPFLDRLAAEGVRFSRSVVNTLATLPSHTTILSSLPQEEHRVGWDEGPLQGIPPEVRMLPEILRDHGYVTLASTGGGNVGAKFGFDRGFDAYRQSARNVRAGARILRKMLANREGWTQPFFVFFHTYQVHSPYLPPSKYRRLFGEYSSTFVPTSENLLAVAYSEQEVRDLLSPEDLDSITALYDGGIRFTDDVLGELFAHLSEIGFLDDAVVVVTSDHGEEFADHGDVLHRGWLYDELLRVPLVFWGSRIPARGVDERPVSSLDIAPTILGCAGIEIPPAMHGRDLLCAPAAPSELSISQFGKERYSVRTPEWKLIETTDPPGLELYHLPSDPRETENRAAEEPRVVAGLRARLRQWLAERTPVAAGAAPDVELDAEEIERLRALGYLAE